MPLWRTDPPSHISLDRLAVTTHRIALSSPLGHRNGEASTLLAEEGQECGYLVGASDVVMRKIIENSDK